MSICQTCGHDPLDDVDEYKYDLDEANLGSFSDEDIESEYFARFSDHNELAEEIRQDMNLNKDVSTKIRHLIQEMTGKLVLT